MSLRETALAAAEAARVQRIDVAREELAAVLEPYPVDALEVAAETAEFVVFSDDGVCLAVRDTGAPRVLLVSDDQGWTRRHEVTTLAELGRLIAAGV